MFHRVLLTALIALMTLTTLAAFAQQAGDDDGWVSLFDGQSLDGWRASENPDSFKVRDGMLIVDGPRAHLFYEGPVSQANFTDFEVKMKVMTFPRANSGVFVHTKFQDDGWPRQGYELQVNATHSDRIKTGSVYGVKNVMDQAPHQDNEWFEYHIIVKGKTITAKVNGEVVNEFTEPEGVEGPRKLGSGTIALQAHDPRSVIHYKDVKIKVGG